MNNPKTPFDLDISADNVRVGMWEDKGRDDIAHTRMGPIYYISRPLNSTYVCLRYSYQGMEVIELVDSEDSTICAQALTSGCEIAGDRSWSGIRTFGNMEKDKAKVILEQGRWWENRLRQVEGDADLVQMYHTNTLAAGRSPGSFGRGVTAAKLITD